VRIRSSLKYIAGAAIIFFLAALWYFNRDTVTVSDSRLTCGAVVEITVIGKDREALSDAVTAALDRIDEIDRVTDRFTATSEISGINRRKVPGPIPVSRDMMEMLVISREASELTDGAFDVTVTPVFDLWGFDIGGRLPEPDEIRTKMKSVDYRRIVIDERGGTITLPDGATKIDLGGIAQGYAAREAKKVLVECGVKSGIINVSGDIAVIGKKNGKPWRIGVQDPRDGKRLCAVIRADDKAVVTSGDYERCFFVDGVRYHHIIDPHTGYPARLSESVTVVTDDAAFADVLSTAIFVLGPKRGVELARRIGTFDVLVVADDGTISYSPGLDEVMELVR
jgi:thiamine biosynthesis lipoprotein